MGLSGLKNREGFLEWLDYTEPFGILFVWKGGLKI